MMEGYATAKREAVPQADRWNIEDFYADDGIWEKDYKKLDHDMIQMQQYKGNLGKDPKNLLSVLQLEDKLNELQGKIYVYAYLKFYEDTGNSTYQKMVGKAQTISGRLDEVCSFIEPEILQISEEVLEKFLKENLELQPYQMYLERLLRVKEHVLDEKTEKMLSMVQDIADGPANTYQLFLNADLQFPEVIGNDGKKVPLTQGSYIPLLNSSNQEVRKGVFSTFYHRFEEFENTVSSLYINNLKQAAFFAKVRAYDSALEYSLSSNQVPVKVYDNLLTTVHRNLDKMYRYLALRKKAFGVEKLHMYDMYAPMIPNSDREFSYEEAKEIVLKGVYPLGEDYMHQLSKGLEDGWVDPYENKGKRGGAYSWGTYGVHPFVSMNFQGNLGSVFTLAHEMGHAMHSYYSKETQPFRYSSYKIFVAEVASTVNEALLIRYLLSQAETKKERASFINYFLERFRTTIYRQTMFAEFEKITHDKVKKEEALNAEELNTIYYELNKKYFGEETEVDREIAIEWARIPHFYTPFYVYQYATGFSAAIAISSKLWEGDEEVRQGYLEFLSSGCRKDPIDLLRLAKVDMMEEKPIQEALNVFESYIKELEELLPEI